MFICLFDWFAYFDFEGSFFGLVDLKGWMQITCVPMRKFWKIGLKLRTILIQYIDIVRHTAQGFADGVLEAHSIG